MWKLEDKPLKGLELAKQVFIKSIGITYKHPEVLLFFVLSIIFNSIIFYTFSLLFSEPATHILLTWKKNIQIDPTVTDYGDFLKSYSVGLITFKKFLIETLKSMTIFFSNTWLIIALGRYIKNLYLADGKNILKTLMLESSLIKKLFFWAILFQTFFLISTYALDQTLSFLPFTGLYYSLSYTFASLLIFYINPLFSFEKLSLKETIKKLFLYMNQTRIANLSWIIFATVWLHIFGPPRTQITLETITLISGALLIFKIILSPITAVFWYWHIKLQAAE